MEENNKLIRQLESLDSSDIDLLIDVLNNLKIERVKTNIPVSIFTEKLSVFESIVKYFREEKNLTNKEISKILKRDPVPIGVIYSHAKTKFPLRLNVDPSETIDSQIFDSDKSVFATIILYLKGKNYSFRQIAAILKRSYNTVYTTYRKNALRRDSK